MDKLNLFVCDNFLPDFHRILSEEEIGDVVLISYPSLCESRYRKEEALACVRAGMGKTGQGVLLCSRHCEMNTLLMEEKNLEVLDSETCFQHLVDEATQQTLLARGGHLIGSGWLKNWQQRLAEEGFDQETAKRFYGETCQELVFLDVGSIPNTEALLKALSEYLDIPFTRIPVSPEAGRQTLLSAIYRWRLSGMESLQSSLSEAQSQCAEYAALFDVMGKIASLKNRRDVIEKIRDIFLMVFGAQVFHYWGQATKQEEIPEEILRLMNSEDPNERFIKETDRFCIRIQYNGKTHGVLDISQFLFPTYLDRYLNFALEIAGICGLVFSNIEQYEMIVKSEQNMQYLSQHDVLTGLYNRAYINEVFENDKGISPCTVFMFDIDKLKYVNDHYGHEAGDRLIVGAAELLKKCFRETDILARIGGDEFFAIVPDAREEHAVVIRKRIHEEMGAHHLGMTDPSTRIGISIGYAVSEQAGMEPDVLMNLADERMYLDKQQRRLSDSATP